MRFGSGPWCEKWGSPALSQAQFGDHFRQKIAKNVIQKGIRKSMPKKYRKCMPKGSQHEAKMDAESMDFSKKVKIWPGPNFIKCAKWHGEAPRAPKKMFLILGLGPILGPFFGLGGPLPIPPPSSLSAFRLVLWVY